jgi:hypothetical protein
MASEKDFAVGTKPKMPVLVRAGVLPVLGALFYEGVRLLPAAVQGGWLAGTVAILALVLLAIAIAETVRDKLGKGAERIGPGQPHCTTDVSVTTRLDALDQSTGSYSRKF